MDLNGFLINENINSIKDKIDENLKNNILSINLNIILCANEEGYYLSHESFTEDTELYIKNLIYKKNKKTAIMMGKNTWNIFSKKYSNILNVVISRSHLKLRSGTIQLSHLSQMIGLYKELKITEIYVIGGPALIDSILNIKGLCKNIFVFKINNNLHLQLHLHSHLHKKIPDFEKNYVLKENTDIKDQSEGGDTVGRKIYTLI